MQAKLQAEFGKSLRKAREKKGFSLRQLEAESGVSFSLIGAIERGKRYAGENTLRRLAHALGIEGEECEDFVIRGLNFARRNRIKSDFEDYPSEFLHALLASIKRQLPEFKPAKIVDASLDHIIPPSKGGRNTYDNLVHNLRWRMEDGTEYELVMEIREIRSPARRPQPRKSPKAGN